jgi:lysophospholipase L1-like esterase
MSLTVIGESTAAGCGVKSHAEGMAGQLAQALLEAADLSAVRWTVSARNGATAFDCRLSLVSDLPRRADVAVVLIGVNDVLRRTPSDAWTDDLEILLRALDRRVDRIIVVGIPDFSGFPSLPPLLADFLNEKRSQLNACSQRILRHRPSAMWVSADQLPTEADHFFAPDGFHPSAIGYAHWARTLVPEVLGEADRPGVVK